MNIIVNSQVLANELRLLNKITASKATIPVLNNILFRAEEDLHLAATDLQVALTTSCKATIVEPGQITLPARKLLELLEQIPNGDVTIVADKHHAHVTSGAFKSRLQTLAASEFPRMPEVDGQVQTLPSGALRTLIDRVTYAISDKSGQYVLKGSLLSLYGTVFAMVATDGKRMSLSTANRPEGTAVSVIVPLKTLDVLTSYCDGKNLEFSCTDRHLFFVAGKRTLISQMVEGQFPKYDRIIPKDCDKKATVDRIALTAALRRVGAVSGEDQAIYFEFSTDALRLTTKNAEIGDADEQMPAAYVGSDLRLALNGSHVLDFLDKASQPSISIDLKNESTPVLFTDGPDFINVLMGMRP